MHSAVCIFFFIRFSNCAFFPDFISEKAFKLKMNPQYSQPPPPNQNFQAPPQQPNYNGNQFPPNVIFLHKFMHFTKSLIHQIFFVQNLPNQMAGLSLNNDYGAQKPPQPHTQPIPNQQGFGNMPPQAAYPNKPMMPVVQQQPAAAPNNRPPMPPSNNPMSFAPPPSANGTQLNNQVPTPFNGSANQFSPQVRHPYESDSNCANFDKITNI